MILFLPVNILIERVIFEDMSIKYLSTRRKNKKNYPSFQYGCKNELRFIIILSFLPVEKFVCPRFGFYVTLLG